MSLFFSGVHFPFVFLFRVALSIHSSSFSFCLLTFFAENFSVCSNPGSFSFSALFTTISLFFLALCLSNCQPSSLATILSPSSTSKALSLAILFVDCSTPVTLALCRSLSLSLSGRLALRLKPVLYTLHYLCCCLLT